MIMGLRSGRNGRWLNCVDADKVMRLPKRYAEPYRTPGLPIHLIGVRFVVELIRVRFISVAHQLPGLVGNMVAGPV
jgi:hypothetical protein